MGQPVNLDIQLVCQSCSMSIAGDETLFALLILLGESVDAMINVANDDNGGTSRGKSMRKRFFELDGCIGPILLSLALV